MEKKNNDQNIELENRMRAKYEKYDKDSQVVLKLGHEKKKKKDYDEKDLVLLCLSQKQY